MEEYNMRNRSIIALALVALAFCGGTALAEDTVKVVRGTTVLMIDSGGLGTVAFQGMCAVNDESSLLKFYASDDLGFHQFPVVSGKKRSITASERELESAFTWGTYWDRNLQPGDHHKFQTFVLDNDMATQVLYSDEITILTVNRGRDIPPLETLTESSYTVQAGNLPLQLAEDEMVRVNGWVKEGVFGVNLYAIQESHLTWTVIPASENPQGNWDHRSVFLPLGQHTPFAIDWYGGESVTEYDKTVDVGFYAQELADADYLCVALLTPQGDDGHISENIYFLVRIARP